MTDREFKRLSRPQLIDVIYQLQLKQDELVTNNARLEKALEDKRIRVNQAGSIAAAAMEINNVIQSTQNAAIQYLDEVQLQIDEEAKRLRLEAQEEVAAILAKAREEADAIIAKAQEYAEEIRKQAEEEKMDYDLVVEAILQEFM